MYHFDRSDELRFRVNDIERAAAAARSLAELREIDPTDRVAVRYGLGQRIVRAGARIAGLRPDTTWHHLLQHSCTE